MVVVVIEAALPTATTTPGFSLTAVTSSCSTSARPGGVVGVQTDGGPGPKGPRTAGSTSEWTAAALVDQGQCPGSRCGRRFRHRPDRSLRPRWPASPSRWRRPHPVGRCLDMTMRIDPMGPPSAPAERWPVEPSPVEPVARQTVVVVILYAGETTATPAPLSDLRGSRPYRVRRHPLDDGLVLRPSRRQISSHVSGMAGQARKGQRCVALPRHCRAQHQPQTGFGLPRFGGLELGVGFRVSKRHVASRARWGLSRRSMLSWYRQKPRPLPHSTDWTDRGAGPMPPHSNRPRWKPGPSKKLPRCCQFGVVAGVTPRRRSLRHCRGRVAPTVIPEGVEARTRPPDQPALLGFRPS